MYLSVVCQKYMGIIKHGIHCLSLPHLTSVLEASKQLGNKDALHDKGTSL